MGTYKVIQDIEAEDKLLGPLTLRQFVYAAIVIVSLFIGFKLMTTSSTVVKAMTIFLIPHTVFFAVLAAPFGHDQSNEVWLLAKVRFFFKPRIRIWDQTGMKELVTITAPKVVEKRLTKDFSRDEARNRLRALANTLDTRGWAVKSAGYGATSQPVVPVYSNNIVTPTDRLVDVPTDDPMVEDNITTPYDDLDNETAQKIVAQINKSKDRYRDQLSNLVRIPTTKDIMESKKKPEPVSNENIDWFAPEEPENIPPPKASTNYNNQNAGHYVERNNNLRNANNPYDSSVTTPNNPAIIDNAFNDDLNVSTIQHVVNEKVDKKTDKKDDDEVVISLR
jgi:hypothetical protein